MPLNYSKWDQLELSDDSDIEEHPNVDKRSLIRWKQRDIHEKREARKHKIGQLEAQIACNNVLLPRIQQIATTLKSDTADKPRTVYFNSLVEQLEKNPSKDCPPGNDPSKLEHTYDGMLLSLLRQVGDSANVAVKEAAVSADEREERLGKALAQGIAEHVTQLKQTIDDDGKTLAEELKEQKKHITSEDLHDGFSNKYVPPQPAPAPLPIAAKLDPPTSKKKTTTTTEYEVINAPSESKAEEAIDEDDEVDDDIANLTPVLEAFSQIPIRAFEQSFSYIQQHRDVVVAGASDSLLGAAFKAQYDGKPKYAKQCVHQSLLLQYGDKLGVDGLSVFFKKMIAGDKRAESVFLDDVEKTYNHLAHRVKKNQEEAKNGGRETIMLQTDNETDISFNVPTGPPPKELVLGEGMEDMDIEEVRKALQFRWDVFRGLPENLQKALQTEQLSEVNKVLGAMEVEEAEDVLQRLDMAGIIPFSESGVRDETPAGRAAAGLAEPEVD
ncbi:Cdc37 N terminal kinase binding-domain-containing protein [Mycena amicta]|nr:Cdc37 N terminal kinase binding-domain-containing protein [Mycena amicta]